MSFVQQPPELGNQYRDDRMLRTYLRRVLPAAVLSEIEPQLDRMGELAGGELYRLQLEDLPNEPVLTRWDAWGNRVDRVEPTRVWRRAERLAAEKGLVAIAYEGAHGAASRFHQMAMVYLFTASTDIYSCPLAMTDGAARALLEAGNEALVARALPRLTSRDPARSWTSGQWMTETPGGSDVGGTETVARREGGEAGGWRLWGRKWFTSAVDSQMALTLARPEGSPAGSRGLALFYLELRDAAGRLQRVRIERLKDKLGTRKLPTASLTLEGVPAEPVAGLTGGVRNIAPMLNVTRMWNAVSAIALMRRGLALARDYAGRRTAFGKPLAEQPLHLDTLAALQAELEGAFHLTFRVVELMGRAEAGEASDAERRLWRVLTPVAKLTTARQAVAVLSEVLESFGGAGYVEDTGLPALLRDAQVLPIWEGTTNVLALDALRALAADPDLEVLAGELERTLGPVAGDGDVSQLATAAMTARRAFERAATWWRAAAAEPPRVEAGARRFALTLGRAFELALLVEQARWSHAREGDARPAAAARRLAAAGVDAIARLDPCDAAGRADSRLLATDRAPAPAAAAVPEPAGATSSEPAGRAPA